MMIITLLYMAATPLKVILCVIGIAGCVITGAYWAGSTDHPRDPDDVINRWKQNFKRFAVVLAFGALLPTSKMLITADMYTIQDIREMILADK